MNYQGANSIENFHGKGKANAIKLFYGESAPLFAKLIRNNLKVGKYTLVDLGGHKGEVLGDMLPLLPEYEFDAIVIDKVEGMDEKVKAKKVVGDIIGNKLPDKCADVVLMRYVLPWDSFENQKLILQEMQRICKNFALVQHQGALSDNPKPLQSASLKLLSGTIPALKRDFGLFTEAKQVETWMTELNINFEKIDQKYIETLSEMFIEKFNLNDTDAQTTKNILSGCDGIEITTWLLKF